MVGNCSAPDTVFTGKPRCSTSMGNIINAWEDAFQARGLGCPTFGMASRVADRFGSWPLLKQGPVLEKGACLWAAFLGEYKHISVGQAMEQKQLQKESMGRLNEMRSMLQNNVVADVSAKNLGEEGCAYIADALAFNDRHAPGFGVRPCPLLCRLKLRQGIHALGLHWRPACPCKGLWLPAPSLICRD